MTLAILGGRPTFATAVPLARPYLGRQQRIVDDMIDMLASGILTDGPYTRRLEESVSQRFHTHCVALSSCTTGLILAFRALGLRGEVILPGFTFFASGHALLWNGLTPVFADCDPETFTLNPGSVENLINRRTAAILAVNVFGNPPDLPALARLAERAGVPLIVDAAQAMGSRCQGRPPGHHGLIEVCSLTPSKMVCAGEGGLLLTNDPGVARRIRVLRNYGNDGDYNPSLLGLNGRLSELHAAVAQESLRSLQTHVNLRQRVAAEYRKNLADAPGILFQTVREGNVCGYKDFAIRVGPEFGLSRNLLSRVLSRENIQTRRYFDPPLHRQVLYQRFRPRAPLNHTERLSEEMLCLPIFGSLSLQTVDRICGVIGKARQWALEIRAGSVGPPESKSTAVLV